MGQILYRSLVPSKKTASLRVLSAVDAKIPEKLGHASHQIWMQIWNRDLNITDDLVLIEALERAGIKNGEDFIKMGNQNEIKERRRV